MNPARDTCTRPQKLKQVNEAQCSPCGIQGPFLQEEREAGARLRLPARFEFAPVRV